MADRAGFEPAMVVRESKLVLQPAMELLPEGGIRNAMIRVSA